MTRNYNTLKNIVKENKDSLASFDCVKCTLTFRKMNYPHKEKIITFYLDDSTRPCNHAHVSILYGSQFYGVINIIELKRENTTATTEFDSRYSSVLDTKLLINGEVYYHWRVMTNGHYDQQIYWEIKKD